MSAAQRSSARVLVIDLRAEAHEPFLGALGPRVSTFGDLPSSGECRRFPIAVGIYDQGKPEPGARLAKWAHSAALAILAVALDERTAVVGPLTVPGRAGCGHCALQRMLAAAAGSGNGYEPDLTEGGGGAIDLAREVVTHELAAVQAVGYEGTSVLNSVLLVDARDGSVTSHEFVPLAHCPVCGGAAQFLRRPAQGSSPPGANGTLSAWVDELTGVIPALVLDSIPDGMSLPVIATAAPPHVVDDDGSVRRLPVGWGKGLTPADAVRSAVGEAIERYSASLPDPARIVWKRVDDLDGELLDPRQFPLYTDEQYARKGFPFVRFDPSVRHPWVRGRWLATDGDVWIPAVTVFLSLSVERENMICQGSSSGLAASSAPDDAALRATLELIERDAFMIAWITGACGTRVEIDDSLEPGLREVLDGVEAQGGCVEVMLLPTSSCGTAVICLALGDGEAWPGVAFGLAADLEPGRAVRNAMLELGQTGPHLSRLMRSGSLDVPRDEQAVRDMLDHAAFYFPAARASAFDALREARETISLRELLTWEGERSLEALASSMDAAGIRVALVDATAPDVATGPFRVVRAVSPDLQPISYGYGLERVPVERAHTRALAEPCSIHPIW